MELIEREEFLSLLHSKFDRMAADEGHTLFITGEAGIGKTSLVKAFCKEVKHRCRVYQGACDSMFTPRPLAPLFDVMGQFNNGPLPGNHSIEERTGLFVNFFRELCRLEGKTVLVFEDIHWADEATLDFIKFLARRISPLRCLFILTYRDNEVGARHPLRNVLGQLIPGSYTKMQLPPLSRQAVDMLAARKGYDGSSIYSISGGNPFYVNELLEEYHAEIPETILDSILFAYNRCDERSKIVWDMLAVMPGALELEYLQKITPAYADELAICLDNRLLIIENGSIGFKHELFRKTIESLISPINKIKIHKNILETFLPDFEKKGEIERIVHHAQKANDYALVARYAPLAAARAASVGAHAEAARLYQSAIEHDPGKDTDILIGLYESYAYECYLTYQIKEAIVYTVKSLNLWKQKQDTEKVGNSLRFLSRLWWYDGNRQKAERYGAEAIEIFERQPVSKAKAMAYSNMSQLKMLSEQPEACMHFGEQAIAMAKALGDEEILSHALNNVGNVYLTLLLEKEKGFALLEQSLELALKNAFHEHVARAYTNLSYSAMVIKEYKRAAEYAEAGIQYCEARDMNSWSTYMFSGLARLKLETGHWADAMLLAENLLMQENQSPIIRITALIVAATIRLRRGDMSVLPLLMEAKEKAAETMEPQRIIPALSALLEYEWISGQHYLQQEELDHALRLSEERGNIYEYSRYAFWLWKARKQKADLKAVYEGYQISNPASTAKAAALWEKLGCAYEQALLLFEGTEEDKKRALNITDALGATSVHEKMKMQMRASGIKRIPRGMRKSTRSNTVFLTERELAVLQLLKENLQNKEIASRLFISPKTVDNHISSILFKLDVNSRAKAVSKALLLDIIK